MWAWLVQSVQRLATTWTVRGSNLVAGRDFSYPPTVPGARPASYTMDIGSFPRVKRPKRGTDDPSHLARRLKKEYSYTSTPLCAFIASYRVNVTLFV